VRTSSRSSAMLVAATLLVGCATAGPGAAATVNGEDIPRSQLEAAVRELEGDVEALPAEERELRVGAQQRQILTFLIQERILASILAEQGIEVTEADVAASREQLIDSIGGEDQLEVVLEQAGLTRSLFEDVIVPQEARVAALRTALLGERSLETRTTRHILVETREEADEIVAELAGGGDFAAIASERSTDPGSGAMGGDLGSAPRGAYVPEFDEAVWNADVNEVVGPIETQFGFHIIEVTATASRPAEELSPQQADQLVGAEITALVEAAFDAADITIGAGLGEWDREARRVVAATEVGEGSGG
jgi:peptidyl-prolyl cis-trans isomerase C